MEEKKLFYYSVYLNVSQGHFTFFIFYKSSNQFSNFNYLVSVEILYLINSIWSGSVIVFTPPDAIKISTKSWINNKVISYQNYFVEKLSELGLMLGINITQKTHLFWNDQ